MNFGAFATPERHVIFDINDFDETLPAPWEWDIKRLATSFLIASRSNGFSEPDARKTALASVRSYRERMAEFAQMPTLDVWYARLDLETILLSIKDQEAQKRLRPWSGVHLRPSASPGWHGARHGARTTNC